VPSGSLTTSWCRHRDDWNFFVTVVADVCTK
jgi:hypothetical protein